MPFTKVLNDILDAVPESIGAIIVDYEGECVQLATKIDEYDVKVIGAYQIIYFDSLKNLLTKDLKIGDAKTVIIKTDGMDIISMRINDEYIISLVMNQDAMSGPAEHVLVGKMNELRSIM